MRDVSVLTHINKSNNMFLLGVFDTDRINEFIDRYKQLPGFCEPDGRFVTKPLYIDGNYAWNALVWNEEANGEEPVIYDEWFDNESSAKAFLYGILDLADYDEHCLNKHMVNKMEWSEGYVNYLS